MKRIRDEDPDGGESKRAREGGASEMAATAATAGSETKVEAKTAAVAGAGAGGATPAAGTGGGAGAAAAATGAGATVDESLYSRQLYVFGHEGQVRMQATNVLIVGLAGLGAEIAKNVILAGVKSVGLLDDTKVSLHDLGAQFYLTAAHVGTRARAEASLEQLTGLNRYVNTHVVSGGLSEETVVRGDYHVVVVTGRPVSEQLVINAYCRKNRVKFISGDCHGVFGAAFVDVGDAHTITDLDGEPCARGLLINVAQAAPGVVLVHEDQRHNLSDGDLVTFDEVEGMTPLNNSPPRPVKVLTPFSFSIEDTTGYPAFTGTKGYFQQVKAQRIMPFVPLSACIATPKIIADYDGKALQLHCLYNGLSAFQAEKKRLPAADSKEDADALVALARTFTATLEAKVELDEKFLFRVGRASNGELNPVCAFMGGVIGQEVLKACSGKFTPIQQQLYFDASSCLPSDETDLKEFSITTPSRYDSQIEVLGRTLHTKITNLRYFLVGAGAIGCEMMKNWSLMGLGTGSSGGIHITDMDTIEKSNLNRQFLFRPADVGKLKSKAAADAVLRMNPALRVDSQALRVSSDTEDVYDYKFWESLDGVCTALDNVQARVYVDSRCVFFQKPLVDSGTLGTKGNTQVIVPFITESYGSSRDPPEAGIPVCTLKNFPNKIEHTIQWARDAFEGDFKQQPEEVNQYIQSATFLEDIKKRPNEVIGTLGNIRTCLVTQRARTYDDCVAWARLQFQQLFHNTVVQLLTAFPADHMVGTPPQPFWSGPKRPPVPLIFDEKDPAHMDFIESAARLRAFNFGITPVADPAFYPTSLAKVVVPVFVPDRAAKVAANDSEYKAMAETVDDGLETKVKVLVDALPAPSTLGEFKAFPVDFEKDDDSNYHIAYITACSNLRARNYKIREETRHQTKFITGKIIPAIATTTALVTGLVCLELYKIIQKKPVEAYRNTFVNLAVSLFSWGEPFPPPGGLKTTKLKDREWKWSALWDRIEIDIGDVSMERFISHFESIYSVEVESVAYQSAVLYASFKKKNMSLPLTALIKKTLEKDVDPREKYFTLEVLASNAAGEAIDLPIVRFKYK